MRILQLRMTHGVSRHVAGTKIASGSRRCAAKVRVMHSQVYVRKPRTGVQRSKTATVVRAKTYRAKAPAVTSIPGMEMVAGTERQPSNRAAEPKSESQSESDPKARAKAKE